MRSIFIVFPGFLERRFFHGSHIFTSLIAGIVTMTVLREIERVRNVKHSTTDSFVRSFIHSFEYRDPSRERHLEILMPTVDLHPASGGCRSREITFYDPLAHSYRRSGVTGEEFPRIFAQGLFVDPFFFWIRQNNLSERT